MVAIVGKHLPPAKKHAGIPEEMAINRPGLSRPVELSVTDRFGPPGARPIATAWVSDRLLADTIDVWSRAYDRPITAEEALEILTNVKRFGELLIRAKEESKT